MGERRNIRTTTRRRDAVEPPGLYSVGVVADMLRVCEKTVAGWVDAGRICGAHRLPKVGSRRGAGDRRIPAAGLAAFLRAQGMPEWMALAADPRPEWLAVGLTAADAGRLSEVVPLTVRVLAAADGYEAGGAIARRTPAGVVVSLSAGRSVAVRVAAAVPAGTRAVALVGDDHGDPADLLAAGFAAVFAPPYDWATVAAAVVGAKAAGKGVGK